MSINMNPLANQINGLQTYRFAPSKDRKDNDVSVPWSDEIDISPEGTERAAGEPEFSADSFGQKLAAMTREEFNDMVQTWREENQTPLEINKYASVDPDGSIWVKAYFDSYAQQAMTEKNAVQSYYADALREAQRPTLPESLNFIASKYQCSWSENFAKDMSDSERQWAYNQLKTMLMGGSPALNDPYALASMGGVKTVEDHTKAAKEAANKVLDDLARQAGLV